jgi:hypothetical protein
MDPYLDVSRDTCTNPVENHDYLEPESLVQTVLDQISLVVGQRVNRIVREGRMSSG